MFTLFCYSKFLISIISPHMETLLPPTQVQVRPKPVAFAAGHPLGLASDKHFPRKNMTTHPNHPQPPSNKGATCLPPECQSSWSLSFAENLFLTIIFYYIYNIIICHVSFFQSLSATHVHMRATRQTDQLNWFVSIPHGLKTMTALNHKLINTKLGHWF